MYRDKTAHLPQVTDTLISEGCIDYTYSWIELAVDTDYIDQYVSSYHTIAVTVTSM
jgi:hypothetical protein